MADKMLPRGDATPLFRAPLAQVCPCETFPLGVSHKGERVELQRLLLVHGRIEQTACFDAEGVAVSYWVRREDTGAAAWEEERDVLFEDAAGRAMPRAWWSRTG